MTISQSLGPTFSTETTPSGSFPQLSSTTHKQHGC